MPLTRSNGRRAATLTAVLLAVTMGACDSTQSFRPDELFWGLLTMHTTRTTGGEFRTAPTGVFFRGTVTVLPSAAVKPDTCDASRNFTGSSGSLTGVTYLDAGNALNVSVGTSTGSVPRISSAGVTTYGFAAGSTMGIRPGDSVIVNVPGATGGYPPATMRAKTAEALTWQNPTVSTNGFMQLRWSAPSDTNSSVYVQLLWAPRGGSGAITREIRCSFRDDGVDSIPAARFAEWNDSTHVLRSVQATRIRTNLLQISGGALHLISTFQVPTPQP